MFNNLRYIFIAFSIVSIFISFWLFSRFTVDDAFITWRYGQNLVNFGIWNYNPSNLDLTQAYTNPIYAILSIIPAYFAIDVVLFFKFLSIFILAGFFIYFYSKTKSLLMTLMAYATPSLFIHAFSGLETFLFIALLVILFITLDENKPLKSLLVTAALMLTRPEAWLLIILVPTYFLVKNHLDTYKSFDDIKSIYKRIPSFFKDGKSIKLSLALFITIGFFLFAYFYIHKAMFGYALPNTFYSKSGNALNIAANIDIFALTFATVLILTLLSLSKRLTLSLLFGGFFLVVGLQYSTSGLAMNYSARFMFHILMPVYFILVYVASKNDSVDFLLSDTQEKKKFKVKGKFYMNLVAFFLFALITFQNSNALNLIQLSTYYPRVLDSHAELGKALNKLKESGRISSFSFGDAGITAYHSELNAFDNTGLGSSLLVQNGISKELLDLYDPQVIVFQANLNGIRLKNNNQEFIKSWADNKNYSYLCDVYWRPDYLLRVYAAKKIRQINLVCENSKISNDMSDRRYLKSLLKAPFHYWHD